MITIRSAEKDDMHSVLQLIQELADFENEPEAVEVTLRDLQDHGFGTEPRFKCFVAEMNQNIIGLALVYDRYSTWKGPAIHLEDLIVQKAHRGKGVGTLLLNRVITYAKESGVKRLGWEVLDWNVNAIDFYKSKGAKILENWRVVQMDEMALINYAYEK